MTLEAPEATFEDDDDGQSAFAFYENITGKAEKPVEDDSEGAVEAPTDGGDAETKEASKDPVDGSETSADDDEGEVELSYGEDKRKVSVKDIKRLMEAEKSITADSAAITADRQAAQAVTRRAETALSNMLERARQDYEPYSKLNFLVLAKDPNVTAEVLEQVQKEAQAAFDRVQYFQTELNGIGQQAAAEAHAANQKAASEAIKVLNDSNSSNHIPGFGKDVYEGIVNFAAAQGMNRDSVLSITDPAALKMIHMAMEFQKSQTTSATKVAKVVQKPTKVLKPSAASSSTNASTKNTEALARLRRTGSDEDAVAAFMASFRADD